MKILKPTLMLFTRFFIFTGIPVALIYGINASYPGLLDPRYLHSLHIAMYLGIPIVIFYFLADVWKGWKSTFSEIVALTLVLVYTVLIMGFGNSHFSYKNLDFHIFYVPLLLLIIIGVLIRFPVPILRFLAEDREEEVNDSYEE